MDQSRDETLEELMKSISESWPHRGWYYQPTTPEDIIKHRNRLPVEKRMVEEFLLERLLPRLIEF